MSAWCPRLLFLIGCCYAGINTGVAGAQTLQCVPLQRDTDPFGKISYEIDRVWSGVRVGFSAVASDDALWVAYYDQERWLTVAAVDFNRHRICRTRLDSRFSGWDSHNKTMLAISRDGSLHLAANMHASPLFYARTTGGTEIDSFRLQAMTGRDETQVTYPDFIQAANGDLLFLYRAGRSGDGSWLMNRWDGEHWIRLGTLFAADSDKGSVSAYPSSFERDAAGNYHVAIVWRRNADVRSNFAVSYARTADFLNWYRADGKRITGPLRPATADQVEGSGENSGLLNNPRLILIGQQLPILMFTRYAADGHNALIMARPAGSGWLIRQIAESRSRTELRGGGSIAAVPHFDGHDAGNGRLLVTMQFPGEDIQTRSVDAKTLVVLDAVHNVPKSTIELPVEPNDLADPVPVSLSVRATDGRILGSLTWMAQAPNRDQPRSCDSAAPRACNPPPSLLRFVAVKDSLVVQ